MHRITGSLAWPQQESNPGVLTEPSEEPLSLWPGRGGPWTSSALLQAQFPSPSLPEPVLL